MSVGGIWFGIVLLQLALAGRFLTPLVVEVHIERVPKERVHKHWSDT